jgi:hypothetical protein
VEPVPDVDNALQELYLRFNFDLTSEEYKKAELSEIEGLPYDKKYLRPPRAKWTL